jgi:hypothetical protein
MLIGALLVIALVLFFFGAWSRWWPSNPPFYPTFVSAGLFFITLALLLWLYGGHRLLSP